MASENAHHVLVQCAPAPPAVQPITPEPGPFAASGFEQQATPLCARALEPGQAMMRRPADASPLAKGVVGTQWTPAQRSEVTLHALRTSGTCHTHTHTRLGAKCVPASMEFWEVGVGSSVQIEWVDQFFHFT